MTSTTNMRKVINSTILANCTRSTVWPKIVTAPNT